MRSAAARYALSIVISALFASGCGGSEDSPAVTGGDVAEDTHTGDATISPDGVGGPCTRDDECPTDSAGVCSHSVCRQGLCATEALPVGTVCDDGDPCTKGDQCAESGGSVTCQSATPSCDDGNACNGVETCGAEGCTAGTPPNCTDEDLCNGAETCDPTKGCVPGATLTCPDDDNACNGLERCDAATGCTSAGAPNCDDGTTCTVDSCDPSAGCTHNTDPGAVCCKADADCDDDNVCTAETCNVSTGKCSSSPKDGGTCGAGSACAGPGACSGGQCNATPEANCATLCTLEGGAGDIVECTVKLARLDVDEPSAVAIAFSLTWPESATLVGLVDQACLPGGVCNTVVLPESTNSLSPSGHTVLLTPATPAAWTTSLALEIAHLGSPNAPLTDAYVEAEAVTGDAGLFTLRFKLTAATAGVVKLLGVDASGPDALALTSAVVDGTILTSPTPCGDTLCADLNPCSADTCTAGKCDHSVSPGGCDDGNPCTTEDTCAAGGGCVGAAFATKGTSCPAGNLCTEVGACDGAGACDITSKAPPTCNDGGECFTSACNPATGECGLEPKTSAPCTDGNACTSNDLCSGAGVCTGTTTTCDDGIACTLDACDPTSGCASTPDDATCDNGDACTTGSCSIAKAGCVQAPNLANCNDNDPCTKGDVCSLGQCNGTPDVALCGCTKDADCIAKDDGNPCTGTMVCDAGVCTVDPSTVVTCPPDGYACKTDYACNAGTGLCDGPAVSCDDGIACTIDACDPKVGCTNTAPSGCAIGWICELSGSVGDTVDCTVRVANKTNTPAATGMDVTLHWEPTQAKLVDLVDTACIGATCFEYPLVECQPDGTACVYGTLEPTHHVVVGVPKAKKDWASKLALLSYHASAPGTALTSAIVGSSGTVTGESAVLVARFQLTSTIAAGAPMRVTVSDVKLNPSSGLELPFAIGNASGERLFITEVK